MPTLPISHNSRALLDTAAIRNALDFKASKRRITGQPSASHVASSAAA